MRPEALAPATPETTTSSIGALARRFAGDFGGTLALTGAFRAFGTVEIFFFGVVPTDFACAVNDFFEAGLAFLRSINN
jgi:hypothetical protein